jgi:hypothetical protein
MTSGVGGGCNLLTQALAARQQLGRAGHLAKASDAVGDQQRPWGRLHISAINQMCVHIEVARHDILVRSVDRLRGSGGNDRSGLGDPGDLAVVDNHRRARSQRAVARIYHGDSVDDRSGRHRDFLRRDRAANQDSDRCSDYSFKKRHSVPSPG